MKRKSVILLLCGIILVGGAFYVYHSHSIIVSGNELECETEQIDANEISTESTPFCPIPTQNKACDEESETQTCSF